MRGGNISTALIFAHRGLLREGLRTGIADAAVSKDGMTVSGDSIMGLLMLAASRGTTIHVETKGAEAEKLADALETLVSGRFGEEF